MRDPRNSGYSVRHPSIKEAQEKEAEKRASVKEAVRRMSEKRERE